jgi:RNA polymerase sigma factor (sigma-70 family)
MKFKYPKDLAEGLKHDDEKALAYLHDNYYSFLKHYADNIIRNPMAAEDIAICSLNIAWDHRRRFNDMVHLERFLYKVTRNNAINFLRRMERMKKHEIEQAYQHAMKEENNPDEYGLTRIQMLQKIYEVAGLLPEKQRRVFELFLMEHSFREIAERLGTAQSTARNNHKKALANIRKLLGLKVILFILWVHSG